jgi:hypothetical protein
MFQQSKSKGMNSPDSKGGQPIRLRTDEMPINKAGGNRHGGKMKKRSGRR